MCIYLSDILIDRELFDRGRDHKNNLLSNILSYLYTKHMAAKKKAAKKHAKKHVAKKKKAAKKHKRA